VGAEYVVRIVKTTAAVAAVAALFCATYFSPAAGLGLAAGAAWGCLNLLATGYVVRTLLSAEKPGKLRVLKLSLVKFPLLYGAGFLLLRARVFPPESLVSGFSLVLLVIFLKALGASVAGSLSPGPGPGRLQPGGRLLAKRR
jgi:hypothetical protein